MTAPAVVDGHPEAPRAERAGSWAFAEGDELVPGRTVLRSLGGGSMHEALLVWDEERYAVMVAKVLRPGLTEDADALRATRKEAEAAAALPHPVIVRHFDTILDGPRPHLLMEHLEGATLRSVIRRGGPLPHEQLLPLALHVASALHFLAVRGWVHLDLKPDNIVMGLPPRVIDLSLARTVERARRLTGPTGTDAFMPPEQCVPEQRALQIGPPSDVFGLGATLVYALNGARPWARADGDRDSPDPAVRFPQLADEPVELPRRTDPELAGLIGDMLAADPAARPVAADVVGRLEPLVQRLPRKLVLSRRGSRMR